MLATISSRELTEWQAFLQLEVEREEKETEKQQRGR